MKNIVFLLIGSYLIILSGLVFSQDTNEATEPSVKGPGFLDLLKGGTLNAWKVPSALWHLENGSVVAQTGTNALQTPEWLYTKQRFTNFEFTCEMKLTGDDRRNTGVYFRANTIRYNNKFEAPSGYEFDAAPANNYWGSLGDWYVRPSLRIYADQAVMKQAVKPDDWNRMTIRARDNRVEYWVNGIKVMDYTDHDPKGSREGVIGFQIHDGSVMKIEYRNIRVLSLSLKP